MLSEKVQELEQENHELKKRIQLLDEMYGDRGELPKDCRHCKNFSQHYLRHGNEFHPTYDGHCADGNRIKPRKINDTCVSFLKKEYGENYI